MRGITKIYVYKKINVGIFKSTMSKKQSKNLPPIIKYTQDKKIPNNNNNEFIR